MTIEDRLQKALDRRTADGSLRSLIFSSSGEEITQESKSTKLPTRKQITDFSSNDYLGLAHCPQQLEKVSKKFETFRKMLFQSHDENNTSIPPLLGATGSRLLSGDSFLSNKVEKELAEIHNREGALLFNSGYDANLSVLSCIPLPQDFILMDDLCHNSIIMGVRMGRGRNDNITKVSGEVIMFKHNDSSHLNQILKDIESRVLGDSKIFIVVESVYSMDGDVAPLTEIFHLAEIHKASVIIDEAHGLGVYGITNCDDLNITNKKTLRANQIECEGGTGVLAALGLETHPNCLCSVHTFGKAAGCHGAVVAAPTTVIQYLINYARPFIYSTALPPHSIISIKCAYETMLSKEGERRRSKVFHLVDLFRKEAMKRNIPLLKSPSPIQAVLTNRLAHKYKSKMSNNEACIYLAKRIRQNGMSVYPIRYPTVKNGEERIRIILHSHNTEQDVKRLLNVLKDAFYGSQQSVNEEKAIPLSRL